MHFILLALALALQSFSAAAGERVDIEFRCFTGGPNDKTHVEWRTFSDRPTKWVAGYVRYQRSETPISLVFQSSEATQKPSGRPWEFTSRWLEVVDGRISGEYVVVTQGANVYGFSYKNLRNGKTTEFWQDIAAMKEDRCEWE